MNPNIPLLWGRWGWTPAMLQHGPQPAPSPQERDARQGTSEVPSPQASRCTEPSTRRAAATGADRRGRLEATRGSGEICILRDRSAGLAVKAITPDSRSQAAGTKSRQRSTDSRSWAGSVRGAVAQRSGCSAWTHSLSSAAVVLCYALTPPACL